MKPQAMAEETLHIMEQGSYKNRQGELVPITTLLKNSRAGTKLYTPYELETIALHDRQGQYETVYEVNNETTLDAARRLIADGEPRVLCLNFASAKNPGGGFLGGAVAQEETIARASGLYPTLLLQDMYYKFNRTCGTALYSDYMIYSPDVPVFRYENGELMNSPVLVSVVTSPAVNAGAIAQNEPGRIAEIVPVMRTRTEKLLALCTEQRQEVLVLGAWGCGVFRNDPDMIAGLFQELLEGRYKGCFRKIVFAVKTNKEPMLQAFASRFPSR